MPKKKRNRIDKEMLEEMLASHIELLAPETFSSVAVSTSSRPRRVVWLNVKQGASRLETAQVTQAVNEIFKHFDSVLPLVEILQEEDLPTQAKLLRLIKIHSPISPTSLAATIWREDASIDRQKWLTKRFDSLRREGYLIRMETDKYALTGLGLETTAHDISRMSSDVQRALALARKKW